eukprot:1185540-Prorocentrum_minimum.AAC.3
MAASARAEQAHPVPVGIREAAHAARGDGHGGGRGAAGNAPPRPHAERHRPHAVGMCPLQLPPERNSPDRSAGAQKGPYLKKGLDYVHVGIISGTESAPDVAARHCLSARIDMTVRDCGPVGLRAERIFSQRSILQEPRVRRAGLPISYRALRSLDRRYRRTDRYAAAPAWLDSSFRAIPNPN